MFGLFRRREARAIQSIPKTDLARLTGKSVDLVWLSASDIEVTVPRALGVPAVWAAVNFIAGTIAGLPLEVYRKGREGDRDRVTGGIARVLHDAVNDQMSSFEWRKYTFEQVLTGGRAVTFIERAPSGRVLNLWPLEPDRVTIERGPDGVRRYRYKMSDEREAVYAASEVIDLPFMLQRDQLSHYSPIMRCRDAIALAIAATEYGSKYFQNGGVPPFVVTGNFQSVDAMRRAGEDFEQAVRMAAKEGRQALVVPADVEIKNVGASPEDGQLLEAKRFAVEEIARVYSLPPVFLQDLTHGTYSNVEQQDLHFVKHTMKRWIEQAEQEMNLKLFGRTGTQFVEFNVDGLLRGDFKTRMDGYALAIQNAVRTPNEVRRKENLPPMPGGDQLMIQGATIPLDMAGATVGADAAGSGEESDTGGGNAV